MAKSTTGFCAGALENRLQVSPVAKSATGFCARALEKRLQEFVPMGKSTTGFCTGRTGALENRLQISPVGKSTTGICTGQGPWKTDYRFHRWENRLQEFVPDRGLGKPTTDFTDGKIDYRNLYRAGALENRLQVSLVGKSTTGFVPPPRCLKHKLYLVALFICELVQYNV